MDPARSFTRVALAAAMLIAGCAGDRDATAGPAATGPVRGGTVVIASPEDIDAANPLVSQVGPAQDFNQHVLFLPLVEYGPNLEIQPLLATDWQMTGDTGVVFSMRHDVLWHDGRRTTAYDAEFTFERAMDPETAYPGAGNLAWITGVEALDSFTVRFAWTPHSDPLAAFATLPLVPAHALDTVPPTATARAAFNQSPIGNGPFRFVAHRPNDRWEFEANPDYPEALGGRPWIDRLVWRLIPEPAARIVELRTGGADLILKVNADEYPGLAVEPGLEGIVRPSRNYAFIGWNGRRPPLGDPVVRKALMTAIDRQQMIDGLRSGSGTLAIGPIGPYHWAYADTVAPLPFDPDGAKAVLAGAGIQDRDGDGTLDLSDGRPFEFSLSYPSEQPFMRDVAELTQRDLEAIGVHVTLEPLEFGTLVGRITSPARDFDALVMGWESDYRANLRDIYHSAALAGPFQIAGYANPEVDSLIDRIAVTMDREAAVPLYIRLQTILRDEQPWGYLYYFPDFEVARTRLRGVEMDERGVFVNVGQWWLSDAGVAQ